MDTVVAFIDKEKAAELKISIDAIVSPHQIWDTEGLGVVFSARRWSAEHPSYALYEKNPAYVKKFLDAED